MMIDIWVQDRDWDIGIWDSDLKLEIWTKDCDRKQEFRIWIEIDDWYLEI